MPGNEKQLIHLPGGLAFKPHTDLLDGNIHFDLNYWAPKDSGHKTVGWTSNIGEMMLRDKPHYVQISITRASTHPSGSRIQLKAIPTYAKSFGGEIILALDLIHDLHKNEVRIMRPEVIGSRLASPEQREVLMGLVIANDLYLRTF